ncbi:chromosome segregation protein SMC [Brucella anthropi]|uniref:Chromosome partition protein Smc n=1 Tax=Brucella anthropi (strain ATCC 49188 / DSM 6882 / CCUG 24695 / JCM 21032 / LMG 3331 / NBRC 15819 / NCTC 12168 / Alc 37) TaxID=439375 RepID=A6WWJ0_BRUA4|nr:chromosome segregation protein SMC [Brucella anthropi]ABS13344.1 chromosome segregation protein SMC [Brucella anthropi ATCC 49188]KAB2740710.1 chromosome segregation protein SMC [Brucella anthropi]MDH0366218.1 chromosome segregation protein SMC [Brucella anthropi]QQC24426.1 chromosome segregation protein SMC [Brucella anthropi]SUA61115.1 Chromosome partition protein Smc [Brucella anthropi]
MRFSRLRLVGFKSFVEPMEFVIEGGLTGVVGPNGCGKSNLVEALRWVMGENSYKNMRASGMDDVIFSGSATRPARNTAEVTLFLDNSDRTAPAAYNDADELQVSRRIERESGSVYRINGKEARAKDVQLLFADQSTGARSPSMVGQGRIGELIQAKPQARRALLEEAAGISGLHTRRHEAELRLRAAETNLERLDDVVGELGSQIESLKRQARQANRFKALSADIRRAEAALLHLRWSQAKMQEGEAQSALAQATSAVGDMAQAQMNAAKVQAVGAHKLPELREAEAKAAAALQRLSIARTQLDEEGERLRARRAELIKRLEQLSADVAREEEMMRENADILARLDDEEQELIAAAEESGERDQELHALFEEAEVRLQDSENALSRVTAERAEAAAERVQIERALKETRDRRDRLSVQMEAIERDIAAVAEQIGGLFDPAEKRIVVDSCMEALAFAEEMVATAEELVASAREAEAASRQPLSEARTELNRIETEAQTLARILNASETGQFPPVVEELRVEKGYEVALGAALGEDLDAASDENAPVYWAYNPAANADPALPDGVTPLDRLVEGPQQLRRRLAQVGVVSESEGKRLQTMLRPGQRLVSKTGALWRWDGYTASADAPTPAAQRLAQKNRLAELEQEAIAARKRAEQAEQDVQRTEVGVREAVEQERVARDQWRAKQRKLDEAREALAAAERAAGQLATRRAGLEDSKAHLKENLEEAQIRVTEAEDRLDAMPDIDAIGERLAALSSEVMSDRTALAEARAAYEGLRREADARKRRLEMIALERRNWKTRAENADRHIAALNDRRAETADEAEVLAEAPDEIEGRRRALLNELSQADALRKQAGDILAEAEAAQAELDKTAALAIQQLAASREQRARAEERLAAAEERRKDAEARIAEALNCPPHEAIRQTGLGPDEALPDPDQLERQLERLKIDRERLGAVNLRADEEQEELSGRLGIIVSEREDVIEAIKKLRQAIQSLNREGRERLLAAFDVVNVQFQRLFTHLFGGGTAELQLIESDDPLEAGLEILARPPGKKPQTMTLLSGGEQALTAMALIFAVFLTNPAPICVLDEVDAPLDDHNVERYCNLMDEMAASTETRFVVITHNPITMARMNRLFGVTMGEQGVSQLVSVDLQTAERLREAG